jgi:hypothetical protein
MYSFKQIASSNFASRHFQHSTRRVTYEVALENGNLKDIGNGLSNAINAKIQELVQLDDVAPTDKVNICIDTPELTTPIWRIYKPASEFRLSNLYDQLMSIQESKQNEIFAEGLISVSLNVQRVAEGDGHLKRNVPLKGGSIMPKERMARRSSKLEVADNYCLARSIVVGMKFLQYKNKTLRRKPWEDYKQDKRGAQTIDALALMNEVGLPHDRFLGQADVEIMANYFKKDYRLVVFTLDPNPKRFYDSENFEAKNLIILGLEDRHYTPYKNLEVLFKVDKVCQYCFVSYRKDHKCKRKCDYCQSRFNADACQFEHEIECDDCNRCFPSMACYDAHLPKTCATLRVCKQCSRTLKDKEIAVHNCLLRTCDRCKEDFTTERHFCHIRPLNGDKLAKQDAEAHSIYIAWDIETVFNSPDPLSQHNAVIINAKSCCTLCKNEPGDCDLCQKYDRDFVGLDCTDRFMEDLLCNYKNVVDNKEKMKKYGGRINVIVFAHNGSRFDNHFVLNWLRNKAVKPKRVIFRSNSILALDIENFKFRDSCEYGKMPLAKLGKAFGLKHAKSHAPHFITDAHLDWVGSWPELSAYGPLNCKTAEEVAELTAYRNQKSAEKEVFVWRDEMLEYCRNDVDTLLDFVWTFRTLMMEATNLDPYARSITITAAVMEVFRAKYLKPHKIGINPKYGYGPPKKTSRDANIWLRYVEITENLELEREVSFGNYKVDGYHRGTNTAYEYAGCHYHGCAECHKTKRTETRVNERTYDQVYIDFMRKMEFIKSNANLVVFWDHDKKTVNKKLWNKTKTKIPPVDGRQRMVPTDLLKGGMTEVFKHKLETTGDRYLSYYDFCSLYPTMLIRKAYPIGHPRVYEFDFPDIDTIQIGAVHCRVLPPTDLLVPPLSYRIHNRLMFPLCRSCVENLQIDECTHGDVDRSLEGHWFTEELQEAIKVGYKIEEIYELWHWESVCQYNPATGEEGLFSTFMNTYVKGKICAEGWPQGMSRSEYLSELKRTMDLDVRENEVADKKNPGMRYIYKIILNSFFGKFGQRCDKIEHAFFTEHADLNKLICDPNIEVSRIVITGTSDIVENEIVTREIADVVYKKKEQFQELPDYSSIVTSALTTMYGRMTLWRVLHKLGDRLAYCDTDSMIFLEGEYNPETGRGLGELTDELECYGKGARITKFLASAPKTYHFTGVNDKGEEFNVLKAKGFTLNQRTNQVLTKESFEQMVDLSINLRREGIEIDENNDKLVLKVPQVDFRSDELNNVTSKNVEKKFKFSGLKRVPHPDFTTTPYGFRSTTRPSICTF